MLLDIGFDRVDRVNARPLPTAPKSAGESFDLAFESSLRNMRVNAESAAFYEWYEEAGEALYKATGQRMPNPYAATSPQAITPALLARQAIDRPGSLHQQARTSFDAALRAARETNPDLPDPSGAETEVLSRARGAFEAAERASAVGGAASVAALFAGEAVGALSDPLTLSTLPFGGAARMSGGLALRILKTAMIEGGIAGGTQAGIEVALEDFRERAGVNINSTHSILAAMAGGAALGGLGRAGFEGVDRLLGRRATLAERDAATVLDRATADVESNPLGPGGEAAHQTALDLATLDVAQGRHATVPPELPQRQMIDIPADVATDAGTISARFPDQHHLDLYELGRDLEAGTLLPADRAARSERLFAVFRDFVEETPEAGPMRSVEDLERMAREFFEDVAEEAKTAIRFNRDAGVTRVVDPDLEAQYLETFFERAAARGGPVVPGSRGRVYTPSGRAIDTEFQVIEARDLISSHDENLAVNSAFPSELQPRDRGRAASEAQIAEIAGGLQPERLGSSPDAASGAPIVGPDGVVESGNGRVLALRRVYAQNAEAAQRYRDFLASQGFDAAGLDQPVLVRRRTTPMGPEERVAFTREANASPAMALAASERALSDARAIGNILPIHRGGDIASPLNRDFVRAFAKGLPETERAALMDADGRLSTEGRRRIEGALLARAYGDEAPELIRKLLEADDNDIKAIGGALADVSARWALMRLRTATGEIAQGMDITADVVAAVRVVERSRATGTKVADLMAQGELIGEGMTDTARTILASFYRQHGYQRAAGRKAIAERLDGYLTEAEKTKPGDDMFGATAPTPDQILAATDPMTAQRSLLANEARGTGNLLEKQETFDATVQQARLIAAGDDPDIQIGDTARKASDLLAEAEDGKSLAKEILQSCALGRAAE